MVNFKKLQAVCKDVQASKSSKGNPTATSQPLIITQVQTLTTQNAPQILSTVTAGQPGQFPMQVMVPVNTILVQGQQGAVAMQPQMVGIQPVSMVTSSEVMMQPMMTQNGLSQISNTLVGDMIVNEEFGKF